MARTTSFPLGARACSQLLAVSFSLGLFSWTPSDVLAAERIRNPQVGSVYVYDARLGSVDVRANTFTVHGIVDNRESLTLSVHPKTQLRRAGQRTALSDGKIGEAINGTFTINVNKRVVAMAATFGAPLPPKRLLATKLVEVNGIASAWHVRNPIRGNVTTSVIAMPTTR
jgi:hypothetical protein